MERLQEEAKLGGIYRWGGCCRCMWGEVGGSVSGLEGTRRGRETFDSAGG